MDMTYFDAEKTRDNLVAWIADWFEQNGKDKQRSNHEIVQGNRNKRR